MKNRLYIYLVFPALFAVVLSSSIIYWLLKNPVEDFTVSQPGLDKKFAVAVAVENVKIGEFFERKSSSENVLNDQWPRFRGENFDNIKNSAIKLIDKFPEDTAVLWSAELGEGHAGPAIYKGMVYLLDYDEQMKSDMLRCFSLTNGEEIWRRWYKVHVKRNHGMSRTVPAVTEDYILTIGPRCHVMCVDRKTGDYLWGIDIEKDYESEVPLWYTGQCPLIDNNIAVIATGGKALMIGVDMKTREKIWETPNPDQWKMSHSSIMPFVFNGVKMYVYSAVGGIFGVKAEGPDAGKILWKTNAWNKSVIAPSPVCMPDGKIFLTAGYGAGSMVLKLKGSENNFTVEVLQDYKPVDGLACEQQTPVFTDGLLFGIMPKDGGVLRNQLVCVDPDNCKKIIWSSGKETRFGLGPYILADGKFFLLNDEGSLFIIKKSTKGYIQLDERKIFDGHDAWGPLAIADGYLLLRDSKNLYCINIKAS